MKPTLLSLLSIILVLAANAQDPQIEWQNTIGGSSYDWLFSIEQTADGGYILGGYSDSGISGDKTETAQSCIYPPPDKCYDYWVIKLNSAGNIEWQNTIGGNGDDQLHSIQQTADGGYILGGFSDSRISGDKTQNFIGTGGGIGAWYDYWVIKLDTAGNITWQNTIGTTGDDRLRSIQQTADGGYILGGSYGSINFGVVKLDAIGNIEWQDTIMAAGNQSSYIQQTADGGFILGGNRGSSFDYWICKLDTAGNIVWQDTIGGADYDILESIQQTADGGYILGGSSWSGISGDKTEPSQGYSDYWVIKTDSAGNIIWQNTIGGGVWDDLQSVQQTADGGYILGGFSDSPISGDKTEYIGSSPGGNDYWVLKLDAAGNIVWQNTIGGGGYDELQSLQQTSDGGYILGGYSGSGIGADKTENVIGGYDYWVVKLSDLHNISGQVLTETGIPVPRATVTLSGDDSQTDITDTTGRYSFTVAAGGNYIVIPSKNNDVTVSNGISSLDIVLMRKHILGIASLGSPYKIIAAAECNADGNTQISTFDILFTRQLILGQITSYPINRLWQFVSSDYVFADPTNPFPFSTSRTYTNITSNQTGQDFIGIKLGDVNGSWDAGVP